MSPSRSFFRNLPIVLAMAFLMAFARPAASAGAPGLKALLAAAEESLLWADLATADGQFRQALQQARASHDLPAQAAARSGLARVLRDPFEAQAQLRLALYLHRQLLDAAGEARDLFTLGETHQLRGNLDEALQALTDALAIARREGFQAEEARTLAQLAIIQRMRGSYEEALFDFEAALEASRRGGKISSEAIALETQLGILYSDLGRYQEAERHLKAASEAGRGLPARPFRLWPSCAGDGARSRINFWREKPRSFLRGRRTGLPTRPRSRPPIPSSFAWRSRSSPRTS